MTSEGSTEYWELLKEIDRKIIEPVLKKMGIVPSAKWRMDSNSVDLYFTGTSDYLQILIDIEENHPVIRIYHGYPEREHADKTHDWICEGEIVFTQEWRASHRIRTLRKKLEKSLLLVKPT